MVKNEGENKLTFDEYQEKSRKYAIYDKIGYDFIYPLIGLNGECGELTEKFKKVIRDECGTFSFAITENIKKEMGDCIWYLSQLAWHLNISFDDIAETNLDKLEKRFQEGKLQGSGDNR